MEIESSSRVTEVKTGVGSPASPPPPATPVSTPTPSSSLRALTALCTIARLHQVAADPATLAHQLGLAPTDSLSTDDLLRACQHLGLKAKLNQTRVERLAVTPLPALALLRDAEGALRVVVLAQCDGKRVLFQANQPGSSGPTIEPVEVFAQAWTGELILITSRAYWPARWPGSTSAGSFQRWSSTAGCWVRCC